MATSLFGNGSFISSLLASAISYLFPGTSAITRSVQSRMQEQMSVKDFGAVGDGVTDDLPAFNLAVAASNVLGNKTIWVPNGVYKINGTLTMTQGTMIMCEGSQGSNEDYGTVFEHYGTGDCFVWNGNGTAFTGTGGGLQNCLILQTGGPGGTTIKVIATDDNHRPGEMVFHNILAYAKESAASLWTRGLVIDGTACNTAGARGVRHVHMKKCRFAETSQAQECIVLNQVTHFFAQGLSTDVGNGVDGDLLLKGINDSVFINGIELGGDLRIIANSASNATTNIHIDGYIAGFFQNDDTTTNGIISLAMSTTANYVLLNKSKHLRCFTNINPVFELARATSVVGVTGNGTVYTIVWDEEAYDPGSVVTAGANTFTCFCAGKYRFDFCVMLDNIVAAHTRTDVVIAQAIGTARSHALVLNPFAIQNGGNVSVPGSVVLDLAYGDTVKITASVSGGAAGSVDIFGTAGTTYSWFNGAYLP